MEIIEEGSVTSQNNQNESFGNNMANHDSFERFDSISKFDIDSTEKMEEGKQGEGGLKIPNFKGGDSNK